MVERAGVRSRVTTVSSAAIRRSLAAMVRRLRTGGSLSRRSAPDGTCRSPHSPSPGAAGFLLPIIHFLHEPAHWIVFAGLRNLAALGQGPTQELLLPPAIQRHLAFDDRIVERGILLLNAGVVAPTGFVAAAHGFCSASFSMA